jgi:hypothetical protein
VAFPVLTTQQGEPLGKSVTLVVYAPFGSDETLSTYPDGVSQDLIQHPLVQHLAKVAQNGVHVVALIDRVDADSHLIEITARRPGSLRVASRWKQDMASPNTLAGLLKHAHSLRPDSSIVLAIEGHGAGFLPEIDRSKLTLQNITDGGKYIWRLGVSDGSPTLPTGAPVLPTGAPVLPTGAPVLPTGAPVLPVNHMPLSTYGLGKALKDAVDAGVLKPAVIHFNNCFNLSAELLHTIAPYADYATGYPNYNFFTAGAAYPKAFARLKKQKTATPAELARWFAEENQAELAAKGNHPTAGGVVKLAVMHEVVEKVDDLADALLASLRNTNGAQRAQVADDIQAAIVVAQQYDTTHGDFTLETPDEMTDLRSLAAALNDPLYSAFGVKDAAEVLWQATEGIKVYGDDDRPWLNVNAEWDFSGDLAMNIFLPDPLRRGLWDWRSPYYLDVNPDPTKPRVQPHIIDFVKVTDWVDFIIEYHKDVPFVGLLPAEIPEFPVFNANFEPPKPQPGNGGPNDPGQSYPPEQTGQTGS